MSDTAKRSQPNCTNQHKFGGEIDSLCNYSERKMNDNMPTEPGTRIRHFNCALADA